MLYAIISNLAVGLCFVPFILLGWKKMRRVNTYCILGIYWLFNGLANLPSLTIFQFAGAHYLLTRLNFYYTLAEAPLVLLAFAIARSGRQRKQVLAVLLLFIIGEILLIVLKGHTFSSSMVIIGTGLLLILFYSCTGLWQYLKKMEHTRFENSMVFVYAALLFAYGSFLIIYIFAHIHPTGADTSDTDSFLLYYISLLLSATVTSAGLWSYGIRRTRQAHPSMA